MYRVAFFTLAAVLIGSVANCIELDLSGSIVDELPENFTMAQEMGVNDSDCLSEVDADPCKGSWADKLASCASSSAPASSTKTTCPPARPAANNDFPHASYENGKLRAHIDSHPRGARGLTAKDIKDDIENAPRGKIIIDAGARGAMKGGLHENLKHVLDLLASNGTIKSGFTWPP